MRKIKEPPIAFGSIFWREVGEKAYWITPIERLLQENIRLEEYGTGLSAIRFVPVAVLPTNKIHQEYIEFFRAPNELVMKLKLDYYAVSEADQSDFLQLVAQLFLRGIEEAPRHEIRDFDWPRFKKDVTELFEAEGWLQPA